MDCCRGETTVLVVEQSWAAACDPWQPDNAAPAVQERRPYFTSRDTTPPCPRRVASDQQTSTSAAFVGWIRFTQPKDIQHRIAGRGTCKECGTRAVRD